MAKAKTVNEEKPFKVDWMDAQEVARHLCGLKEKDDDDDEVDAALYNKYDITVEKFQEVLQDLFKVIDIGISPLTDEAYIGFSSKDDKGRGTWILRKPATSFITCVLQWMGADKIKPPKVKGVEREITSGGKIEFVITVKKPAK